MGGVYSSIYEYSPWVYPSAGDNDTAWSMIETVDGQNWAQVGWWEDTGGTRFDFWQVYRSGWSQPVTHMTSPGQPVGSYHTYTVLYNNTPGQFTFWIDSNHAYGSYSAVFTPNTGITAGESHTLASQIPGATQLPEGFSNTHIYYNTAWQTFAGYLLFNSGGSNLGLNVNSMTDINTWDNACQT